MFATDDTIVAIATPPGVGGIGIVRVSGPRAAPIAGSVLRGEAALEPRRATLRDVIDPRSDGRAVDRVLATYFPRPGSYTGEDVVEISGHGSPVLLREIVRTAREAGARLAEPGEFTFRAFLNGRLDLIQAEAVGDLVEAVTPLQARVAFDQLEGTVTALVADVDRALFDLIARLEASLDFPEEGYHFVEPGAVAAETRALADRITHLLGTAQQGRLVREGCQVVILGRPNVGKSTLFNRLLGAPRAIVTDVPGTTRDLLTDTVDLDGIPVTLVDTAGLRATRDVIEAEGVSRARAALRVAYVVIVVLDRSCPLGPDDLGLLADTAGTPRLVVVNKTDRPARWMPSDVDGVGDEQAVVSVSLLDGDAAEAMRSALAQVLWTGGRLRDPPSISNVRHIELLQAATTALERAAGAAEAAATEELLLVDLQDARRALEEISGRRTPDAVLERIFERFCIGK